MFNSTQTSEQLQLKLNECGLTSKWVCTPTIIPLTLPSNLVFPHGDSQMNLNQEAIINQEDIINLKDNNNNKITLNTATKTTKSTKQPIENPQKNYVRSSM